tara:strand:- start:1014 stop:1574 length:561 start_codon:yes stop_codon:yes gene_type:complete
MELREKLDLLRGVKTPTKGVAKSVLLSLDVGSVVSHGGTPHIVKEVYDYVELKKGGKKGSFSWREYMLINLNNFETSFLEVEDDDGLSASLTIEKIPQGKLTPSPSWDLKSISIEGDKGSSPFYMEEKSKAVFSSISSEEEEVILLDFESDDGKLLGVEVWENGNCEAFIYKEVPVNNLEVIAHDG